MRAAEGALETMELPTQRSVQSSKSLWTGRIVSGLVAAFLLFDAIIHLLKPAPVVEAFAKLGFPMRLAVPLGIVELVCVLLYLIPRTSILGAMLLTGYLGGAVAIQLPTGNPFFGEVLFPVYVGIFLWGGIYLRDERLRTLIPFRN
jgi:hypothetical protein